ncbi:MAG TPA: hypothetical protein VGQ99_21590 [Tepidisphaeraceae bacterium]|nr:hypothetical protein [Tepidisphaeraceae bacterium]
MAVFGGKKFVLIVSSGRTGTKALAQHLSRCYPDVCALHEPSPSWRLRMGTTRALCGRSSREELVELLVKLRRGLVAGLERGIYVESNPYLSGFVEVFGEVFEEVRVVHVVRDPRTYVRSGVNFGAFRGMKKLAAEWWPDWFPRPQMCIEAHGLKWGDMDAIERLAWFWGLVNSQLNRGEGIYGQRYLRIRFEDLFSTDGGGLERLTDWIGLARSSVLREEANREHVNASQREELPEWAKWSEKDRTKVLKHCESLMKVYDYLKDDAAGIEKAVAVEAS